jgi:hypothetical protein
MSILVPKVSTFASSAYLNIRDFIAPFQKPGISFSFDAMKGGYFISASGIRYSIPPMAFTTRYGRPINDKIVLEILEIKSKRALFFLGKSSLSGNHLLDVELAIDIRIPEQLGKGIYQQLPIHCEVAFPKQQRLAGIQLYEEHISRTKSIFSTEEVDWNPSKYSVLIEKTPSEKVLSFNISQMGTLLLGKQRLNSWKLKKLTMFSVEVDQEKEELDDLCAFLVFHDTNSIVQLRSHRNRFSAFHLPPGEKATLLVLGLKNGRFYMFKSFIEKLSSELKKAPLKEISEKDLSTTLKNMIF